MNNTIKTGLLALCMFAGSGMMSVAEAAESPAMIRGIRPLGMGGAFVAVADDQNAVFYNPAGLTQRQASQFTLFELPVNVSDDIFQFYRFYQDNEEGLKDIDSLSADEKAKLFSDIDNTITRYSPRLRVGFPNISYLSGPGYISWGAGLYTQADIGFRIGRGMILPNISYWGTIDAIGALPLAHRFDTVPYLPGKLSVGAALKYIMRSKLEEYNKSILEFEDMDPQLQTGSGVGIDVGTIYHYNERWNFGLQVTDIGGTTLSFAEVTDNDTVTKEQYNGMIPSAWNVGAVYCPAKIYYWPGRSFATRDRVQFAADVRDVLSTDERLLEATFWKKLHLGAEVRLSVFSLRGGFNSGYPTFGFGARIPYLGLRADYAFWGDELGRYAGQMPSWNHQISLALSWGDEKGKKYGSAAAKTQAEISSAPAAAPQKAVPEQQPAVPLAAPTSAVPPQDSGIQPATVPAATAPTAPAAPAGVAPAPVDTPTAPAATAPTSTAAPAAAAEQAADGLAGDGKK